MKNTLATTLMVFAFSLTSFAQRVTLLDQIDPKTYKVHSAPVLDIALVDYGQEQSSEDLAGIKKLLEERFYLATNNMLKLNISVVKSIPYKFQIKNYPNYTNGDITDPKRLQRLWYYDNVNANILSEIYEVVKKTTPSATVKGLDAIVTITGAQFDGLGFAYGRVAVTESPREIAWGLADGGYTEKVSYGKIVDELIHEIGHAIFLDHASNPCQDPKLSYAQQQECCIKSPNKNDVMSYCRERKLVNDADVFYGFEACNLRNIKNKVIPAMMSGGAWNIPNREKCN